MLRSFLLIPVLFFFFSLQSCNNNTCASFDCINGDCDRGTCVCEDGWEGTSCKTPWAQKFIGNFEGRDCYDTGTARYTFSGTKRPDSVIFENKFYAIVTEQNTLDFPEQEVEQDGATFKLKGNGSLTDGILDVTLRYEYDAFDVQCKLTLNRVQ